MKKIILLLTLICAGQLYSMETQKGPDYMAMLPQDAKKYIVLHSHSQTHWKKQLNLSVHLQKPIKNFTQ